MIYILQSLVDVCIESAEELLKSNFGKDVLYEVLFLIDSLWNKKYSK